MKHGRTHEIDAVSFQLAGEETEPLYFRLCHHCCHLNESAEEIGNCLKCDKALNLGARLDEMSAEELMDMSMDEDLDDVTGEGAGISSDSFQIDVSDAQSEEGDELMPSLSGLEVLF